MDIFINWFLNNYVRNLDTSTKVIIIVVALMFATYCIGRIMKDVDSSKKPHFYFGWFVIMCLCFGVMVLYSMH